MSQVHASSRLFSSALMASFHLDQSAHVFASSMVLGSRPSTSLIPANIVCSHAPAAFLSLFVYLLHPSRNDWIPSSTIVNLLGPVDCCLKFGPNGSFGGGFVVWRSPKRGVVR
ncbi:uncharacterized protein F5147DRAFT_774189 [Suillus discolor]|uniref:Uncharacterized protein n=1 Tax=Suillus discolor TaxID=1912936 RepID=A0A9P7F5D7_9AGAM|nr:uncharacterized protein F5147DRAFT_774189 [Suillus discolor]KAG2107745.1 hypothetical protein F5147DRAFT_774189 [Suillus discolor]